MTLKFSGHEAFPKPTKVSAAEVEGNCSGEKNGCFLWDYEWTNEDDVLTVKFKNSVLIIDTLTESEQKDVLSHETRHWQIFQRYAIELKAALEKIVKEGGGPDMDNRLEWLRYDICRENAAFHREVERFPIKICFEPTSTRPK